MIADWLLAASPGLEGLGRNERDSSSSNERMPKVICGQTLESCVLAMDLLTKVGFPCPEALIDLPRTA